MDLTNLNKDRNKQRRRGSMDLATLVYGKVPPQAKEIEGAILGALMMERDAYDSISDIISPETFYVDAHQRIFRTIRKLESKNQPVDILTVVEELKTSEELDIVGGPYYVQNLTSSVVSATNIETHAKIIQQKFIQREIIRTCGELLSDAYEDATDAYTLLGDAEQKIMKIGEENMQGNMKGMDDVLMTTITKIEEWRRLGTAITGIPSGYAGLDHATRGWQNGDLIILAARPSVGKTALALNLIRNAALNQQKPTPVAVWSLEMKAYMLAIRMLAAESKIMLHKIQTGNMSDDDMRQLYEKGVQTLLSSKIFFDDSSHINLISLKSTARRMKKKYGIGLIVVDYIQLMKGTEYTRNRDEEIGKVAIELKNLAMDLDLPVIGISSLSRETEKRLSGKPKLSDLRESGAIEYAADVVMLLYGNSEDEIKQNPTLTNKRYLKIAKQRNGFLVTEEFDFRNEIQLYEKINEVSGGSWKSVRDNQGDNPF